MKTLLILLLLVTANICYGQKDTITPKNIILGANTGIMIHGHAYAFDYFGHFTIEKGKSFLAIGPVIGLKLKPTNGYDYNPVDGQYQLNGLHIVYQLNPNPKGKRFDFYFLNEFMFLYYTDKGVLPFYYLNSYYNYIPVYKSYKFHQTDLEDYIGYGFKVKFLKNFYVNQNIGIGIIYTSSVIDYGDVDYNRSNHSFEPSIILKLGLGYTFNNKLKTATIK